MNDAVLALRKDGMTIKAIARDTRIARQTIGALSADPVTTSSERARVPSILGPSVSMPSGWPDVAIGHGSARVVSERTTRRRSDERAGTSPAGARRSTLDDDPSRYGLGGATMIAATVEGSAPMIAAAREFARQNLDYLQAILGATIR